MAVKRISEILHLAQNELYLNSSEGSNYLKLVGGTQTADRELSYPVLAGSDTLATLALAQELSNKTITAGVFKTNLTLFNTTRNLTIDWSEPATSPRTLSLGDPGGNDSFAYLAAAQTLSAKTLASPTISGSAAYSSHPVFISDLQIVDKKFVEDMMMGKDMQDSVEDRFDPTAAIPAAQLIAGCTQLSDADIQGCELHNTDRWTLYGKLNDADGDRTIELYKDAALSAKVAQGTRTGDGVVTLTQANVSGISGSISVTYTGDDIAWNVLTRRRFLCTVTANGWTADYLYQTDDTADPVGFDEVIPTTGMMVLVDDETDGIYIYGGSSWAKQKWAVSGVWTRTGAVLAPTTAGDTLQVGYGSASVPAYSFSSDVDTGMFGDAAVIGFAIAGAEVGRYTANGLQLGTNTDNSVEKHGKVTLVNDTSAWTDITGLAYVQATFPGFKVSGFIMRNVTDAVPETRWIEIKVFGQDGASPAVDIALDQDDIGTEFGVQFQAVEASGTVKLQYKLSDIKHSAVPQDAIFYFDAKAHMA